MPNHNPFNDSLDWTLQGKYARVIGDAVYEGWIEIVHHQRGSIILHDAILLGSTVPDDGKLAVQTESRADRGHHVGSVFVRTPTEIVTMYPKKEIEYRDVWSLTPYPDHPMDFEPRDEVMQRAYRNGFAGSFPVVRLDGTILNGHKRIVACRRVGIDKHPVEVVDVTDEQAQELFELAHRTDTDAHSTAADDDAAADDGDTSG